MTDKTHRCVTLFSVLALVTLLWSCTPSVMVDGPTAEPPEPAQKPLPEDYKNVLRWATASEVDNFGYDIYRGESEDGPFERVTAEPLLGAGTTDETSEYEYLDTTIDPYKAYWYYVESISKAGKRERFTPVFKTEPQLERQPQP